MPIGIQRINNPHPQPSSQIVFIKPLPGPDEKYAKDFLERVAAICHPIMKANHLSIMTLEEHEANREFVGRNFNAGEIIQLVLKSRATGQWLSFKTVQMVMMHELAHCNQMNHSRNFWKLRNQYAEELRQLWQKGYTGDGLWGRGRTLLSGAYDDGRSLEHDVLPENLCGGAYRRARRRKRRANGPSTNRKNETYAEKKQKRIAKKFGVNGQLLGGDEEQRVKLEQGQSKKAQPRVANSARGRELRANAALARFEVQKKEISEAEIKSQSDVTGEGDESTTDDEYEDVAGNDVRLDDGKRMIKVCEDDDATDTNVKREMEEINELAIQDERDQQQDLEADTTDEEASTKDGNARAAIHDKGAVSRTTKLDPEIETTDQEGEVASRHTSTTPAKLGRICPICSMSNEADSLRCAACMNVLDTVLIQDGWKCPSKSCSQEYINAGDCNLCGICGSRKPGT